MWLHRTIRSTLVVSFPEALLYEEFAELKRLRAFHTLVIEPCMKDDCGQRVVELLLQRIFNASTTGTSYIIGEYYINLKAR
jgi:hypothetical protein